MDIDNPDHRLVPHNPQDDSKENIWLDAGDGAFASVDLTPDFKINLQSKKGTFFGRQDAPWPRPTKPNLQVRVPLGPRDPRGGHGHGHGHDGDDGDAALAVQPDVSVAVLRAEVASQESEMAQLQAKLKYAQRESDLLRRVLVGVIDLHMLTAKGDGV
jgi:hypothetical protein